MLELRLRVPRVIRDGTRTHNPWYPYLKPVWFSCTLDWHYSASTRLPSSPQQSVPSPMRRRHPHKCISQRGSIGGENGECWVCAGSLPTRRGPPQQCGGHDGLPIYSERHPGNRRRKGGKITHHKRQSIGVGGSHAMKQHHGHGPCHEPSVRREGPSPDIWNTSVLKSKPS